MQAFFDLAKGVDLPKYCDELGVRARAASREIAKARSEQKNLWLLEVGKAVLEQEEQIFAANARDVATATEMALSGSSLDRLKLNHGRLESIASGLREVAALPDPIGQVRDSSIRPNGLQVLKVGVPLGVIFFIYESRPNVTIDAASLCVKSGNAIILRGGKEAFHSNAIFCRIMRESLVKVGLPADAVQMVETTDREAVKQLLSLNQYIDLAIPRGGEGLIRLVAAEARMPVLKHYKGNCHVYVDGSADLDMAERIVVNAKCQRPGVCNAAESLLIDQSVAQLFLPRVAESLRRRGVELRGCEQTRQIVPDAKAATAEDFAAEYLDLIISIKIVAGLDEAIEHINHYGSQHSDAIITNDPTAASRFTTEVDSAAVLVNASTRFNDGHEIGLGAEIGISTDKFHARGPCGLVELTSYKYIVYGEGQVRGE